ncbi:hypothetical protein [Ornithinimicrobium sp. CNJ-824]|uniref:hypothetical protein n=1 Tax=Ornithinimicrobium sp. CNJ-824 TaxID=1904966 RepID=UPI00117BEEF7|nr:hypothetical protein [Ornithinimicrobium sp. CNJ-824]
MSTTTRSTTPPAGFIMPDFGDKGRAAPSTNGTPGTATATEAPAPRPTPAPGRWPSSAPRATWTWPTRP